MFFFFFFRQPSMLVCPAWKKYSDTRWDVLHKCYQLFVVVIPTSWASFGYHLSRKTPRVWTSRHTIKKNRTEAYVSLSLITSLHSVQSLIGIGGIVSGANCRLFFFFFYPSYRFFFAVRLFSMFILILRFCFCYSIRTKIYSIVAIAFSFAFVSPLFLPSHVRVFTPRNRKKKCIDKKGGKCNGAMTTFFFLSFIFFFSSSL